MKEATLDQLIHALGWTLLHSLWQTALVALCLYLVLAFAQKLSPNVKYVLGVGALIFAGALSTSTFLDLYFHHQPSLKALQDEVYAGNSFNTLPFQIRYENEAEISQEKQAWQFSELVSIAKAYVNRYLYWIVMGWMLGVLLFSLKFAGSLLYLKKLKTRWVQAVAEKWQVKIQEMSDLLELQQHVKLLSSQVAKVPMMIGHLKPVILIPASMISGLPEEQIEAIIAHEMAHIYRRDYWVNILQSLFEIIFFFHPAIWWINNLIREEREKSCDDLAVAMCGNSLTYAKALANVEAAKLQHSHLALAINGGKSSLLQRIERILEPGKNGGNPIARFVSASLAIAIILLLGTSGNSIAYRYGDKKLSEMLDWQPFTYTKQDTSIHLDIVNGVDVQLDQEVEISEDEDIDIDLEVDISEISDTVPKADKARSMYSLPDSLPTPPNAAIKIPAIPDSLHAYMFSFQGDSNMMKSLGRLKQPSYSYQFQFNGSPTDSGVYHLDSLIDIHGLTKAISPAMVTLDSVLSNLRLRTDEQNFIILQDTTLEKRLRELEASMRVKEREFEKLMREKEEVIRELMQEKEVDLRKHERLMDEQTQEQVEQLKKLMEQQERLSEDQMRKQEKQLQLAGEQLEKLLEIQENRLKLQEEELKRQESRFEKANRALEAELLEDGLIESGEKYTFNISDKGLFLNDEKLSDQYYQKYFKWMKENEVFRYEEGSTLSITRLAK